MLSIWDGQIDLAIPDIAVRVKFPRVFEDFGVVHNCPNEFFVTRGIPPMNIDQPGIRHYDGSLRNEVPIVLVIVYTCVRCT
jgi:hypothetical protein